MPPDDEAADQIAQIRAGIDQAKAASAEFADLMHTYFSELCNQGFNRQEALGLTMAYQSQMLSQGGNE